MTAYYNEIDPHKAAWLRELIAQDLIAPGDVDERSIADVFPGDLRGYTQQHFFAGCGVWSYALRLAGWPDDRPVWTGSCPCQPFSAAGKGRGTADERHLWPYLYHLARCCRPEILLGEQVSSPAGLGWWDIVSADLEAEGYAPWAVDFSSAGVGAPIIRQRLYWMARAAGTRSWAGLRDHGSAEIGRLLAGDGGSAGGMVRTNGAGWEPGRSGSEATGHRGSTESAGSVGWLERPESRGRGELRDAALAGGGGHPDGADIAGGMGSPSGEGLARRQSQRGDDESQLAPTERASGAVDWANATAGFWRDPDWLFCRDGNWRPVESSPLSMADGVADLLGFVRHQGQLFSFPLKKGAQARTMRLRGYGDAINAEAARAFIEVVMKVLP